MKTKISKILLLMAICLPLVKGWAEDAVKASDEGNTSPMLEAVDIPTADILDPKTFSTSFGDFMMASPLADRAAVRSHATVVW